MLRPLAGTALALGLLAGCSSVPTTSARGAEHGIEVVGILLTGGGSGDLARLEFRVLDAERARRALSAELSLVGTGSAIALPVLSAGRLGPLRQRPSGIGKKRFVLFRNTGHVLRRGGSAALVLGAARIEGIPVR